MEGSFDDLTQILTWYLHGGYENHTNFSKSSRSLDLDSNMTHKRNIPTQRPPRPGTRCCMISVMGPHGD
jgi:hypothetical protein